MTTPVRIAIAGFGMFGQRHAATVRANPDTQLVAVADPAPAAQRAADAQGVTAYAGTAAMLDATQPDALIVATPNREHVPAALAAVARGIPVLVEKPVAETVESAQVLVAAAANAGVPVLVGHHRRYNPIIERARAAVRDGELGRIVAVNALFLIRKPDDYFDVAWRREPGGGPVLINLIHDVDNLRYVVGEIADVTGFASNALRGNPVEDACAVALRFGNGALGTALLSDGTPAPWSWELTSGEAAMYPQRVDNCYLISGTHGALAVPTLTYWHYTGTPGWTAPLERRTLAVEHADPQVRQLAHFVRVVRGEELPRIDAADAARTLATTLAIARVAGASPVPSPAFAGDTSVPAAMPR
ncbi:MAG: Gfo/Idh/MocA family oxidoreductase [Proteobacteria bacterium]|nr:Gfo/Idh/MocA family oxidoreductase [Pseudomonadota bacterium]